VRGFFAGDAFMAMAVCDARDFDGTLRREAIASVRQAWANRSSHRAIHYQVHLSEGQKRAVCTLVACSGGKGIVARVAEAYNSKGRSPNRKFLLVYLPRPANGEEFLGCGR
jgi:hypothetical protein